jgi:murein DD-endopeptidase MepM/ murein hydrolase activator NlpD
MKVGSKRLISRFVKKSSGGNVAGTARSVQSIRADDLEFDHHNPFGDEEPVQHRWLMTTCAAGCTGAMIIAAAVMGLFGEGTQPNSALASANPTEIWQRPAVTSKGDFNGEIGEVATLRPYQTVALQSDEHSTEISISSGTTASETTPTVITGSLGASAASLYPDITDDELLYNENSKTVVLDSQFEMPSTEPTNITEISKTPPPEPIDKHIVLAAGETLQGRLVELGIDLSTANALTEAIEPVFPSKLMKAGQKFTITLDQQQDFSGNDVLYPVQASFSPGPSEDIIVEADEDGRFIARLNGETEGTRSRYAALPHYRTAGKISATLYATARDQGVPENVINEVTRAFSFDLDFQRQVRAGDQFEIFYGEPLSGSSKTRKVMHYATLNVQGKPKTYYRFTTKDGRTGYYDSKGQSASRSLMRTPISGARISSGFGMRRHPILGYTKMHTGIDFAVPRGTPIRAAGSGVIGFAKWRGAYGRAVQIEHSKGYSTLYAHMHRFASGIRQGVRVRQGQVIGYVGSTGRSTGPHLHYEVRKNNKPVNPKRLRITGTTKLAGAEFEAFKRQKAKILALAKTAPTTSRVVQASNQ